jgi:hypothetical protein
MLISRDTAMAKRVIIWQDDRSLKPYIAYPSKEDRAFIDEVAEGRQ